MHVPGPHPARLQRASQTRAPVDKNQDISDRSKSAVEEPSVRDQGQELQTGPDLVY